MGRRESDSSPPMSEVNGCAARMPESMRMVEPEFPASSSARGSWRSPPFMVTRPSAPRSIKAPNPSMQRRVEWQSAPVE